MKWFIASDLHGSAAYCEQMLAAYAREGADRLVLLGDILYHGPRNDLPEGYAPKAVIAALNPLKEQILCVRGNCDTEVDQMVLEFPILADYAVLADGGLTLYLTHGHKFGEQNPPPCPRAASCSAAIPTFRHGMSTKISSMSIPARCPSPRTAATTAICFLKTASLHGRTWRAIR